MSNLIATQADIDLLKRVFSVITTVSDDGDHGLFWRVDDNKLSIFVNCNDVFAWACSDTEQIDQDNIHIFEETAQILQANNELNYGSLIVLFAARSRNMQPQGAIFKNNSPMFNTLLQQAGPEREVGNGNTPKPKDLKLVSEDQIKKPQAAFPIYDFENEEVFLKILEMFAFNDCDCLKFIVEKNKISVYVDGEDYFEQGKDLSFKLIEEKLELIKNIQQLFHNKEPFYALDFYFHKQTSQELPDFLLAQMN